MRIPLYLTIIFLIYASTPTIIYMVDNGDNGLHTSIRLDTPIPGNMSYRGYNVSATLSIHNGCEEPVNISIEPGTGPLQLVWSNYTPVTLNPGADTWFTWIIHVPEDISFGNYTLGFNITYTINSSTYSIYRWAWINVIPRNISLITADLYRDGTGYILVIINPLMDPGQYIIENISVTIEPFNISVEPREAFIDELYANSSYRIPLAINFNESDIGVLAVNIKTYDDVNGPVYFDYTFIVVNASAYLHLCLVDDYGRTLPEALVVIDNETYSTGPDGCLNLVLPIGFHNYTIMYQGHRVSGKLMLHTGYNN